MIRLRGLGGFSYRDPKVKATVPRIWLFGVREAPECRIGRGGMRDSNHVDMAIVASGLAHLAVKARVFVRTVLWPYILGFAVCAALFGTAIATAFAQDWGAVIITGVLGVFSGVMTLMFISDSDPDSERDLTLRVRLQGMFPPKTREIARNATNSRVYDDVAILADVHGCWDLVEEPAPVRSPDPLLLGIKAFRINGDTHYVGFVLDSFNLTPLEKRVAAEFTS